MSDRKPVPFIPGHVIDAKGNLYREERGNLVLVARPGVTARIRVGSSVISANTMTIRDQVFQKARVLPKDVRVTVAAPGQPAVEIEPILADVSSDDPEPGTPAETSDEDTSPLDVESDFEIDPKPKRRRRR